MRLPISKQGSYKNVQYDLFAMLVILVMLYGCEILDYMNLKIVVILQLKFSRNVLKFKINSDVTVYGKS